MLTQTMNKVCAILANFGNEYLMPIMVGSFVFAVIMRALIYYTIRGESNFAKEFEKRVHRHLDREYKDTAGLPFPALTESLLAKTFHEVYKLRAKYLRRKLDSTAGLIDRMFLIEEGATRLIRDTVKQTKYYGERHNRNPDFGEVSKYVFLSNPYFNKVLGVFPLNLFNDLLNTLPGLFIIGGVFNTFLGIMEGLPQLKAMDVSNLATAKAILDGFLMKMALAINTSILGIAFAVGLTLLNVILSPSDLFLTMHDKYKSCLDFLWNDAMNSVVLPLTADPVSETTEEKQDQAA